MQTSFYSERGTRTYELTLGDTTAFSEAFDFSAFAGAVLVVPSGATGNLELQIQVGGSGLGLGLRGARARQGQLRC